MPVYKAEITYGFSQGDKHTHRKWFSGGDNVNHLGVEGSFVFADLLTLPADHSPISNLRTYVENYLVCLSEICAPDVRILGIETTQYDNTDWGNLVVQFHETLDVSGFLPKITNLPLAGPRGRAFIGGRQTVAATNRSGWMRWHYLAGNYMGLPTYCAPSEVSATFATYYTNLRTFGSVGLRYGTMSGAISTTPQVIDESLPSTVLHLGLRNG